MKSVLYLVRCVNGQSARTNTSTCNLPKAILKPGFVAERVNRLLFKAKRKSIFLMEQDPLQIFRSSTNYKYAVVVLNCPICWKDNLLLRVWEEASVTVTVDGGTHRWLTYLKEQGIDVLSGEHSNYLPNLITGDMDSCSLLLLEKLKTTGATIVETSDQSYTDYTKALQQLQQYIKMKDISLNGIYVLAETSGRFDHIIGNINTLYKCDNLVGSVQVIHVASNSLTWLLQPGFHTIRIPEVLVQNNTWCGLLPFGSPVTRITTTGLRWNLNDATLQFGGLVSTSNTYANCTKVTVDTDTPVIWTMGIEPLREMIINHEKF